MQQLKDVCLELAYPFKMQGVFCSLEPEQAAAAYRGERANERQSGNSQLWMPPQPGSRQPIRGEYAWE